jgi:hypothetical protein
MDSFVALVDEMIDGFIDTLYEAIEESLPSDDPSVIEAASGLIITLFDFNVLLTAYAEALKTDPMLDFGPFRLTTTENITDVNGQRVDDPGEQIRMYCVGLARLAPFDLATTALQGYKDFVDGRFHKVCKDLGTALDVTGWIAQ